MTGDDRRVVLWLNGSVPRNARRLLRERDLELLRVKGEPTEATIANARAAVWRLDEREVPAQLPKLRRLNTRISAHGLLTIILQGEGVLGEERYAQFSHVLATRFPSRSTLVKSAFDWRIAQACARRDPGPRVGHVAAALINPTQLTELDQVLVRRAFRDATSISLRKLAGGMSDATAYMAEITRLREGGQEHRMQHFVKIGPEGLIDGELYKLSNVAAPLIAFPFRPAAHSARCVDGAERKILVTDVVQRSTSLREALKHSSPAMQVARLLDVALREVRRTLDVRDERFVSELKRFNGFKYKPELFAVSDEAVSKHAAPLSWITMQERLEKIDQLRIRFRRCHLHGDLHAGNVLSSGEWDHPIVIDFAKFDIGARVVDSACLEVSLLWGSLPDDPTSAEMEALDRLYEAPIEATDWDHEPRAIEAHLLEAASAVRIRGLSYEDTALPYRLALAGFLVRHAAYRENGSLKQRSCAFAIASRIVASIAISGAP